MFARRIGIAVLWATLPGALWAGQGAAAGFPRLEGPVLYLGEYTEAQQPRRVRLLLDASGTFALREETAGGGRAAARETTGRWHQIRDGALLQLTNDAGFYRTLNVGGGGNVYWGRRAASGPRTVPLRRQAAVPEDLPPSPPDSLPGPVPECFWEAVVESRWIRAGEEPPPRTLEFLPGGEGAFRLCRGGDCLRGTYTRRGERLSLSVPAADAATAALRGTRRWRLAGEVLELWDETRLLETWERISGGGNR